MDLGEFIFEVAATYDRTAGLGTPTQQLLRDASTHLSEHAPPGVRIIGSGGKGTATFTPWVGFFDADETSSPQYGVYVVYLFSEDLEHVTLTLNQGMERLRQRYGNSVARTLLAAEAEAVRALLGAQEFAGLRTQIDLGSSGDRQRAYEAGNISSIVYDTGLLPPEEALRADLARFLTTYRLAVEARQGLQALLSDRGTVETPNLAAGGLLADFRPKNADEYTAHLAGRTLTKSRTHEALVRDFGLRAADLGFRVSTPHPRDLTMQKDGTEWLVEAKILYRGNATEAVRAAAGQILSYRHFFYRDRGAPDPRLIALFNELVGGAYCDFLESLGIGVVWRVNDGWRCSESLEAIGLAGP